MNFDQERSRSSTCLLNYNSIVYGGGYGSLNVYHTPELPGADHTPRSPLSQFNMTDEFLRQNINNSNMEYTSLPFSSCHSSHYKLPITAITPQQSAVSSSSYSQF